MARRLGINQHNEMVITDQLSGSEITLYYRMPNNQERIKYQTSLVNVKGFRIRVNSFEVRLKFGLAILVGFRDGDFEIERHGKWEAISSDPESPLYFTDWKKFIEDTAADLVIPLAEAVFEGARAMPNEGEEEDHVTPENVVTGDGPTGKNFRKPSLGILTSDG